MRFTLVVSLVLALVFIASRSGLAQPAKPGAPVQAPQPIPVDKLAIHPAGLPSRALRYELVALTDSVSGDAGPHWKKAFQLRQQQPQIKDEEWKWISREVPLNQVPVAELRKLVDQFKETFEAAELASRHERWELPTPHAGPGVDLNDIQRCREIANLLRFRFRLELVEGKFDRAVHTLRVGFALAKHIGDGPSLLHSLVAMAIGSLMTSQVEDFVQVPNAPNLYWALTALPRPYIDVRRQLRLEMDSLTRLVPELRDLDKAPMTAKRAEKLVDDFHTLIVQFASSGEEPVADKKTFMDQVHADYPTAKRLLAKQGLKEQELAAMPEGQTVVLWYWQRYAQIRDDFCKWLFVPYSEGGEGLKRAKSQIPAKKTPVDQLAAGTLGPLEKVLSAQAKVDRRIAALRCVEAIRLYASVHGKLPTKLDEIVDVPIPLDPVTGKSFEYHPYEKGKDSAILIGPAPVGEWPGAHNTLQWELSLQGNR